MEDGHENMFHELEQRYVTLKKEYDGVLGERNILKGIIILLCFADD
jgi:hypothetical protein